MINTEVLKQIYLDQREDFFCEKDFIKRDIILEPYLKSRQIILISGIRRCGKSTLLYEIMKKLNTKNENILYFNFDDERIINFDFNDFNEPYKIHKTFFEVEDKNLIFMFDEIQNIFGFEKFLNRFYEKKIKIFVTGSSSNLLSSEISTTLTGRNLEINLMPFSFREFLKMKKIVVQKKGFSTNDEIKIKKAFNTYLKIGGFPLNIMEQNSQILKSYYSDIIYRDIVSRYNISLVNEIKEIGIYLNTNSTKLFSYEKIKSAVRLKSSSQVKKYLEYFENCFFSYQIKKFDYSLKKQLLNPRKYFICDTGFVNYLSFKFSEDFGRQLENLVFLHFKRKSIYEIFYHKKKFECDFLLKEKDKIVKAIQVTKSLNYENEKREVMGLVEATLEYGLKEGLLLTYEDEERDFVSEGVKIKVRQIWKYLVEN